MSKDDLVRLRHMLDSAHEAVEFKGAQAELVLLLVRKTHPTSQTQNPESKT